MLDHGSTTGEWYVAVRAPTCAAQGFFEPVLSVLEVLFVLGRKGLRGS